MLLLRSCPASEPFQEGAQRGKGRISSMKLRKGNSQVCSKKKKCPDRKIYEAEEKLFPRKAWGI